MSGGVAGNVAELYVFIEGAAITAGKEITNFAQSIASLNPSQDITLLNVVFQ
jgi:hypothetical protein